MQLQQIAERCQQGDREAFALLYTATREQLRGVCLRYVHDETVADDLLHDAFLLIISKIGELKDTARVGTWLSTVMRNVALLYLRQQKQQPHIPLSSCAASSLQGPTENNRGETTLAMQEIMSAVDTLPDGYRRVFRLSVVEGLSHQQIAALLHIEPHSSSSQLFHAKALLRRWLRPLVLLLLAVALPVGLWWRFYGSMETGKLQTPPLTPPLEDWGMEVPEVSRNEYAGAATPLPSARPLAGACSRRVSRREGARGGVCNIPIDGEPEKNNMAEAGLQTPPPTPPLLETLREQAPASGRAEGRGMAAPVISFDKKNGDEPDVAPCHDHSWNVDLAYSAAGGNSSDVQLPFADSGTNTIVCDSLANHHFPFTVSLSVERRIGRHWQVGTGLSYTRLKSDFSIGNTYVSQQQHQTVQYLGLPVSASYHWSLAQRLQVYAKANVTLHLPLRSTRHSYYLMPDGHSEESLTERLHPGLQLSAGMGVGLQYQLTPHVSLFAEPSVQHFFTGGNSVSTWNTEHPFAPSLPFGLKISF